MFTVGSRRTDPPAPEIDHPRHRQSLSDPRCRLLHIRAVAGIRPLVRAGDGSTAALSRDHSILIDPFRPDDRRRRRQADHLAAWPRMPWTSPPPSPPCRPAPAPPEMPPRLIRRPPATAPPAPHGSDAPAILALQRQRPELASPLVAGLARHRRRSRLGLPDEMARTVEDALSRRTRSLLFDAHAAIAAAPAVARRWPTNSAAMTLANRSGRQLPAPSPPATCRRHWLSPAECPWDGAGNPAAKALPAPAALIHGQKLIIAEEALRSQRHRQAIGGFTKQRLLQQVPVLTSRIGHTSLNWPAGKFEVKRGRSGPLRACRWFPALRPGAHDKTESRLKTGRKLIKRKDVDGLINAQTRDGRRT